MAFDFEFMSELLRQAGFKTIYKSSYGNSTLDKFDSLNLQDFERHYESNSLFVEASK